MKINSFLISMVFYCAFLLTPNIAEASSGPSISVCNNCYSDLFWTENARSKGAGTHVIFNLEAGTVRTYLVRKREHPENPSQSTLIVSLSTNSQPVLDALNEAMQLKDTIETYVSLASSSNAPFSLVSTAPIANGCGTEEIKGFI